VVYGLWFIVASRFKIADYLQNPGTVTGNNFLYVPTFLLPNHQTIQPLSLETVFKLSNWLIFYLNNKNAT